MTAPRRAHGPSTRAVHAGDAPARAAEPVVNPIVLSTTFHSQEGGGGEVRYARYGNAPNQLAVQARLEALEGAEDAVAVGSGMAATACALLAHLRVGDHVVAADAIYGGTRALLSDELARFGIETTFVDFFDDRWADALRPETRVVWVEWPANPTMRIADPAPVAAAAHAAGAVLIVDATFASPFNFRPLEHGADLVMHSATKYLAGHSDVTAGVVTGPKERVARVRERATVWGPMLDGHAAWLLERGMKTLALRMERHNANGVAVARWAEAQPAIARVFYPGLASHPDHAVARRLLDGFGGMVGIELHGGAEAATRFVRALELARVAPSLGGVETLVSQPRYTSHATMPPQQREALGIGDGFVRLSVGIEDVDDLLADFAAALRAAGP